jgi:Na+-translocating ferredoxin:NAD+ oxidoreductase RnfA subunit
MEFVFRLLSEQTIIALLQLIVGKWAKGTVWFENKFIPVLTWLCAVVGFTLLPASAHAASLGGVLPVVGSVFGIALFQNFLVTGVHSSFKNTVIPAFWDGVNLLAKIAQNRLQRKVSGKQLED